MRARHPRADRPARRPLRRQRGRAPAAARSRAPSRSCAAEAAGRIALALGVRGILNVQMIVDRRAGGGHRGQPARQPDRADRGQGHRPGRGRRGGALRAGGVAGGGVGCRRASREDGAARGGQGAGRLAVASARASAPSSARRCARRARCSAWPPMRRRPMPWPSRRSPPTGADNGHEEGAARLQYGGSCRPDGPREAPRPRHHRPERPNYSRVRPELPSATGPPSSAADQAPASTPNRGASFVPASAIGLSGGAAACAGAGSGDGADTRRTSRRGSRGRPGRRPGARAESRRWSTGEPNVSGGAPCAANANRTKAAARTKPSRPAAVPYSVGRRQPNQPAAIRAPNRHERADEAEDAGAVAERGDVAEERHEPGRGSRPAGPGAAGRGAREPAAAARRVEARERIGPARQRRRRREDAARGTRRSAALGLLLGVALGSSGSAARRGQRAARVGAPRLGRCGRSLVDMGADCTVPRHGNRPLSDR